MERTDEDIMAAADRLARDLDLDLDKDDRNVIVLAIQRLIWPPSPWYFLHEAPHVVVNIGQRDNGNGWFGELRCPSGCTRAWSVQRGASAETVHGALTAAHQEYRTGRVTASTSLYQGQRRRQVSLDSLLNPVEYVEVTDRRLTQEGAPT